LFGIASSRPLPLPKGAPRNDEKAAAYLIQCSAKVPGGEYDLVLYQTNETTPNAAGVRVPISHIAVVKKQDIEELELKSPPGNRIPPLPGVTGAQAGGAGAGAILFGFMQPVSRAGDNKEAAAKLKPGDKLKVKVIKVDVEQAKIGLTARI